MSLPPTLPIGTPRYDSGAAPAIAPNPLAQSAAKISGVVPVLLLDVMALDGTSYHWASCPITPALIAQIPALAPVLTGTQPAWAALLGLSSWDDNYFPWLLQAGPFHLSRSMQTDVGNFVIQNISGDTIRRDMSTIVTAAEFEGALFVYREFNLEAQAVDFEFHGRLSIVGVTEHDAQFSAEDLFNPNNTQAPADTYSESCRWRWHVQGVVSDPRCGADTSSASCMGTYSTCQSQSRFGGVLTTFLVNLQPTEASVSTRTVVRRRQF